MKKSDSEGNWFIYFDTKSMKRTMLEMNIIETVFCTQIIGFY